MFTGNTSLQRTTSSISMLGSCGLRIAIGRWDPSGQKAAGGWPRWEKLFSRAMREISVGEKPERGCTGKNANGEHLIASTSWK